MRALREEDCVMAHRKQSNLPKLTVNAAAINSHYCGRNNAKDAHHTNF